MVHNFDKKHFNTSIQISFRETYSLLQIFRYQQMISSYQVISVSEEYHSFDWSYSTHELTLSTPIPVYNSTDVIGFQYQGFDPVSYIDIACRWGSFMFFYCHFRWINLEIQIYVKTKRSRFAIWSSASKKLSDHRACHRNSPKRSLKLAWNNH